METSLGLRPTSAPLYGDEAYENGVGRGIANAVARMEQDEASYLWHTFWQIVLKVENRTIGEFDFHQAPGQDGVVAFGYMMRPGSKNRGYVTEAARELTGWALEQSGVSALAAETEKENVASQKVLEKLGAKLLEETDETYRWRMTR